MPQTETKPSTLISTPEADLNVCDCAVTATSSFERFPRKNLSNVKIRIAASCRFKLGLVGAVLKIVPLTQMRGIILAPYLMVQFDVNHTCEFYFQYGYMEV
jgi:hypothetical protein